MEVCHFWPLRSSSPFTQPPVFGNHKSYLFIYEEFGGYYCCCGGGGGSFVVPYISEIIRYFYFSDLYYLA